VGHELLDAEDYRRWNCLWEQVGLIVARLEILREFKLASSDALMQVKALVCDLETVQSFQRATADSELKSPRVSEIQEGLSLSLANLQIEARKVVGVPGSPGPLWIGRLTRYQEELADWKEELISVVTAGYERLKLK
jgi:hypothetical protein